MSSFKLYAYYLWVGNSSVLFSSTSLRGRVIYGTRWYLAIVIKIYLLVSVVFLFIPAEPVLGSHVSVRFCGGQYSGPGVRQTMFFSTG